MIQVLRPKVAYEDERGQITNLLEDLPFPIQHVAFITCKRGAFRGNHVHQEDSHYTYLVSGDMCYTQKEGDMLETVWLEPGDVVFTPAGVPHMMWFADDSVIIAFTTRPRHGGRYEEDTQPYDLTQ